MNLKSTSLHDKIIECLGYLNPERSSHVCMDIGSSNITNIPYELLINGKLSILIEPKNSKLNVLQNKYQSIQNMIYLNQLATPENIGNIITEYIKNEEITLLDIDIDSYDFEVLQELLKFKKPCIIVAEINEKIPFPIRFHVKYNHTWDTSHFFGMSFRSFCDLVKQDYDVVDLNRNNAIAIRKDINTMTVTSSHEEIFNYGYKNPRINGHLAIFDHNSNVDHWLTMETEQCVEEIEKFFIQYKGKYYIGT